MSPRGKYHYGCVTLAHEYPLIHSSPHQTTNFHVIMGQTNFNGCTFCPYQHFNKHAKTILTRMPLIISTIRLNLGSFNIYHLTLSYGKFLLLIFPTSLRGEAISKYEHLSMTRTDTPIFRQKAP